MDKKTQRSIEIASKRLFQLLKEKDSYHYSFPKLSEEIKILYSPDKKFRAFYFKYLVLNYYDGIAHAVNESTDIYAQYRNDANNEFTVKKVECKNWYFQYCDSYTPQIIYQVERNGNPIYVTIYNYQYKELEGYTFIHPIEINKGKMYYCEDCMEDKNARPYPNNPKSGSLISFDKNKQQISFTFNPLVEDSLKFSITKKYILQWNGEQFVPLHLKLYCDK